MSKTNCVNCGAAKDIDALKCPFCGTTYLDFTAIDFTSDDPVVCEFVLPYSKDKVVVNMLALPRMREITFERNDITVYGGFGHAPLYVCPAPPDIRFHLEFEPVAKPETKELLTLRTPG